MRRKKQQLIALIMVFISLIIVVILFFTLQDTDGNSIDSKDPPINTDAYPAIISPIINITDQPMKVEDTFSPAIEIVSEEDTILDEDLVITVERQNYKSGDLTLIIPKLDFSDDVENGTDTVALNNGPALYEYAQLPGEGNRNVSIAAHRNTSRNGVIGEWYFYYIDTLTTGDYLYLTDHVNIYQYEYDRTTIVDAYDWSPIYGQGFSCLTLTSCEPIGISTHRIIVRSKLVDILPYTEDFVYKAAITAN